LVPPVSSLASSGLLSGGELLSEVGLLAVSWPPCSGWKTKWWETSKRGWVDEMRMTCSSVSHVNFAFPWNSSESSG